MSLCPRCGFPLYGDQTTLASPFGLGGQRLPFGAVTINDRYGDIARAEAARDADNIKALDRMDRQRRAERSADIVARYAAGHGFDLVIEFGGAS